ncbi:MAG TPA: coenzyme F420-0:L-glutamate ligase, partial [Candidatus Onthovivens sp.]|nr:coenzyme F420-0:L-glutamate ligase [Candidatus Onthovivens sp.]
MKLEGTISRGLKGPIIKKGDDLKRIIVDVLKENIDAGNFNLQEKDVICITEAVAAKAQGNFVTIKEVASDINTKFDKNKPLGVLFPLTSRNRFGTILKAIKEANSHLILQLSFPGDEVGNKIVDEDEFYSSSFSLGDEFSKDEFKSHFKKTKHIFTGVDYLDFYQSIIGEKSKIILANDPKALLKYTDQVLVASIHSRKRDQKVLLKAGAKVALTLADICNTPNNIHGFNEEYGVLGSNLSKDDTLKLFPRETKKLVLEIQKEIEKEFKVKVEVMVYGDGAFKDPRGGIWELADPTVSPGFTDGLKGTPNEIKIKYVADNKFATLSGESLTNSIKEEIRNKNSDLLGKDISLGTTPRQYSDLLGS